MSDKLDQGGVIDNDSPLISTNGQYEFRLERGNLILLHHRILTWSTNIIGKSGNKAIFSDGNLTLYSNKDAIWSTNSCCYKDASLELKDNGNLVIVNHDDEVIWETDTFDMAAVTPKLPIHLLNNRIHAGHSTAKVDESGDTELFIKGTHSGCTGKSKFSANIVFSDKNQEILFESGWKTLTVGFKFPQCTHDKDETFYFHITGNQIRNFRYGAILLKRHHEDISDRGLDDIFIEFFTRAGRVYKALKDSDLWEILILIAG